MPNQTIVIVKEFETVRVHREGQFGWLTLARPERANSINRQLTMDVNDALTVLDVDPEVRVVLVTGEGERHFCSGADLKEIDTLIGADGTVGDPRRDFLRHIEEIGKPVIAVINGAAMGGGLELALACDFRFLAEEAQVGLPEIRFGALPAAGGTQRLPRLVGLSRARLLILTGEPLGAEDALRIGLVDRTAPAAGLGDAARELASVLADRPAYALSAGKRLLNAAIDMDLTEGLALERQITSTMGTPEEREAARARAMKGSATYRNIFGTR
jgi:enoyl-CoA hydratase/carnithine racemase